MKGKIYHICEDEKFINSAIEQFEGVFPNQNVFCVILTNKNESLKYVTQQSFVNKLNCDDLIDLNNNIQINDLVIFHSLAPSFYNFAKQLSKEIKTVWFCFGFEVYKDPKYFKDYKLLAPITLKLFPNAKKKESLKEKIKNIIRPYFRFFNSNIKFSPSENKVKAIRRMDYLGSSFLEEFQAVNELINEKKKFFAFWYYPLELIVDVSDSVCLPKPNILVGNSGFKSANHLDVFEELKKRKLPKGKIIVPLNYGTKEYIDTIVKEGEKNFGNRFEPLLDFLPLTEYNIKLKEIGVAILYTKRQQAVGNTIALLWFGAKVFLSIKNPFYVFLKRMNIIVFSIENDLCKENAFETINLNEIEHNRKILFDFLNHKKLAVELKQEIEKIYE